MWVISNRLVQQLKYFWKFVRSIRILHFTSNVVSLIFTLLKSNEVTKSLTSGVWAPLGVESYIREKWYNCWHHFRVIVTTHLDERGIVISSVVMVWYDHQNKKWRYVRVNKILQSKWTDYFVIFNNWNNLELSSFQKNYKTHCFTFILLPWRWRMVSHCHTFEWGKRYIDDNEVSCLP